MKQDKKQYRCKTCGEKFPLHTVLQGKMRECPRCHENFPLRLLQRRYDRIRSERGELSLNCQCGAKYRIKRPKGNFLFTCKSCGRYLVQVAPSALDLRGVQVPQFIDAGGGVAKMT